MSEQTPHQQELKAQENDGEATSSEQKRLSKVKRSVARFALGADRPCPRHADFAQQEAAGHQQG
jgi:hypothetical protein